MPKAQDTPSNDGKVKRTLDLAAQGFMLGTKMKTSTAFTIVLLPALACSLAMAKPAPWFKWRSKLDGTLACSQTPLGQGWKQASGPYRDSRCEKLIVVK
jgi:hypothetical protein